MTGVDFSPAALTEARRIAELADAAVDFVESDLYAAPEHLDRGSFDLVYTGIGAICWLPDIRRWARVVAELLRPGGRLFIREGHPVLWSLPDPRPDGLLALELPYFEHTDPLVYTDPGTYVETDVEFVHNTTHTWNRGLGEIVTALIDAGLAVTGLTEHDSAPWDALPGQMHRLGNGEWQLTDRPERLPHTYTLQAVRTAV